MTLNRAMFQQDCNPATVMEAAAALAGLYRWWLAPQALKVLEEFQELGSIPRPVLPNHPGGCWVMIVNTVERTHALLRPAFVLPLEWKPAPDAGHPHDERLPTSVRNVADDVLKTLANVNGVHGKNWGLHLVDDESLSSPNLNSTDLDKRLDASSGWVSLAAGLWTAATALIYGTNICPDKKTWATGCWNEDDGVVGVKEVGSETLAAKLELAAEFGAEDVFVPESQAVKLGKTFEDATGRSVRLGVLRMNEPQPLKALGAYIAALKVPPPPDADPEREQAPHYLTLLSLDPNHVRTDMFYRDRLLSPIARRCRQLLEKAPRRPPTLPSVLVTVVSHNHGLVRLGVETLRARYCLAFHTNDKRMTRLAETAQKEHAHYTQAAGIKCELILQPVPEDPVDMLQEFRKHLNRFLTETVGHATPSDIAFDVTPGTGLMTLAWSHLPQKGNWLLYLRHQYLEDIPRPVPFKESYLMWPAGETWEEHVGLAHSHGDSA